MNAVLRVRAMSSSPRPQIQAADRSGPAVSGLHTACVTCSAVALPPRSKKPPHWAAFLKPGITPELAYWRFDASFFNFFASFFSFGVFKGSFFTAFLLSWLLLMFFAP